MTFPVGTPAQTRDALDALPDPCVVLRPERDSVGEVTHFSTLEANRAAQAHHMPPCGPGTPLFAAFVEALRVATALELDDVEAVPAADWNGGCARFDLRAVPIDGDLFVWWRDSSQHHEQAEALARSERRFRILAEHASDVVLETALDGTIVWVSASLHDVLGHEPTAWIGRHPHDLVIADDRDLLHTIGTTATRTGHGAESIECRFVSASGDSRWMVVRAQPITDGFVVTGGVVGLRDVQDAVVLRRAITTLRSTNEILVRAEEEYELLAEMCEAAVHHAGYMFAWYGRPVDDDAQSVEFAASAQERRDYLDSIHVSWGDNDLGHGPTGVCLRSGEAQMLSDSLADATFKPWAKAAAERGFRSTLSLPVFVNGRVDGAFNLYAAEPRAFDEQAIEVMKEVAAQLGFGLSRLRDEVRLAEALAEQRLLGAAIDQAAEAIVVADTDGLMRYANPAALRNSGYELDEVLGQNPRLFQSGLHDERFYDAMWKRLLGGQPWHGVLMNRRKDGTFYEEESTIAPVHDEAGRRIAFVAVKHDLTRERNLEAVVSREQLDRDTIVSVMRDVRQGDSLEATAASLAAAVQRFDGIDGALVVTLMPDGSAVPVALAGASMPAPSEVGKPLDFAKLALMVELSKAGPWWIDFSDPDGLASMDPEFTRSMTEAGFTASAYAPIRWDGEVFGVMSVATKSASAAAWMPVRLPVLAEIGSFAGMLLGPQAQQHGHRETRRAEIADIIEHERFQVVFEPVIHLPSGAAVGFEALTRFDDGERPDRRFAIADDVGLGPDLEAACARVALRDAARLPESVWVSVNFSPASIVEGRAAEVVRLTTRQVIIEITEHNEIENYAAVRWGIQQCGDVLVAVDDAGAGFASLRHILELQPDIIKLDIALVRDIDVDPARQALAAGLRHFAALTGTTLVAEGIETQAEATAVRQLGVELAQGFLFEHSGVAP